MPMDKQVILDDIIRSRLSLIEPATVWESFPAHESELWRFIKTAFLDEA